MEAISGINVLCDTLQSVRDDVDTRHRRWMDENKKMCEDIEVELCNPRLCGRQQHRDNVPARSPDEYYKQNLTISLLDHVLTLERPSASIDAFEVFNFLYLHRILIFFSKTFGHF